MVYIILWVYGVHYPLSVRCTLSFECTAYIILWVYGVHYPLSVRCTLSFECTVYIILWVYGVHYPLSVRCLFQLRVNLSHHFASNQGVGDTRHFLFEYSRYATHRATLAVGVIELLQRKNLNHLGNQAELYLYE